MVSNERNTQHHTSHCKRLLRCPRVASCFIKRLKRGQLHVSSVLRRPRFSARAISKISPICSTHCSIQPCRRRRVMKRQLDQAPKGLSSSGKYLSPHLQFIILPHALFHNLERFISSESQIQRPQLFRFVIMEPFYHPDVATSLSCDIKAQHTPRIVFL